MTNTFKQIVPKPLELVGGLFLTIAIILLANSKQLLNYYELQSSDQLIKTNAGNSVTEALKAIDSLGATNGVVTFLIWAVVGIVCFGIVEAMGSAYREFKLEQQVSSARYIHPATFSKASFWRGVLANSVTLMISMLLLGIVSLLVALFLVPLGLAYSRVFLFDVSLTNAVNILLGVIVIFAGLFLLNVVTRLLLYRRQIFKLS